MPDDGSLRGNGSGFGGGGFVVVFDVHQGFRCIVCVGDEEVVVLLGARFPSDSQFIHSSCVRAMGREGLLAFWHFGGVVCRGLAHKVRR